MFFQNAGSQLCFRFSSRTAIVLLAVSALSMTIIESGHFKSRRKIEWLRCCYTQQCIWEFPIWWSHFVPVSVGQRLKWFLWFFWLRKTDSSSTINGTTFWCFVFHLSDLSSDCTLFLLLNVLYERLSQWLSHVLPLFFPSFCFCFVSFNLPQSPWTLLTVCA